MHSNSIRGNNFRPLSEADVRIKIENILSWSLKLTRLACFVRLTINGCENLPPQVEEGLFYDAPANLRISSQLLTTIIVASYDTYLI